MDKLQELKSFCRAEIRIDTISQTIYSVDASIFEIKPLGVALPRSIEELIELVQNARLLNLPLIPRGAATGTTGGCLGEGVVVDLSQHLTQIFGFDEKKETVDCQPGVIQDSLNRFLAPFGRRLGPDTSTGNRATLGGMASNNAAGARSLIYGTMRESLVVADLLLYCGKVITLKALSEEEWNQKQSLQDEEGQIYRSLDHIRTHYAEEIVRKFPPLHRRSSGYALDTFLGPFPLNPAKLLAGAEGTLGIITRMELKTAPLLKAKELYFLGYNDINSAARAVPELLTTAPSSLELLDDKILRTGLHAPSLKGKTGWLTSTPAFALVAEYTRTLNPNEVSLLQKGSCLQSIQPQEWPHVWELRKSGLGLLLSKRSYSRALAFIEDIALPPDQLASFFEWFIPYLQSKGKDAGLYGHAGPGCLHIRPYMDLRSPEERALMQEIMIDVARELIKRRGALSGEHGDGWIRSWLNPFLFGPALETAFIELKNAFDPEGGMNPGKKCGSSLPLHHLRLNVASSPPTFLPFEKEGGLALSVDLCNGNGACRKKEGVMCPSFQATGEEFDSTRARAEVFKKALVSPQGLASEELHQILDRCLQCKGCKTECPSSVDMAKMKSEALYHYHLAKGMTFREKIFAHFGSLSEKMFPFRRIAAPLMNSWAGRRLLSLLTIQGPLPVFASERASLLLKQLKQPSGNKIGLSLDTFTEFYHPEIGLAAVSVLNKLGFYVEVIPWSCCGRPAISKGCLPTARELANKRAQLMLPYLNEEVAVLTLEPSCHSVLRDEFSEFIPSALKPYLLSFDEWIIPKIAPYLSLNDSHALWHRHCHQKTHEENGFPCSILEELPSGCCGMAGSFGHEKEHVHLAKEIGELFLFPKVRALPNGTQLIASGTSCRSHIKNHTGKRALHLAEWLDEILY